MTARSAGSSVAFSSALLTLFRLQTRREAEKQASEFALCVNATQVIDVGRKQGASIGQGAPEADAPHPSGTSGMRAGWRVLHNDAVRGLCAQQFGRGQMALGGLPRWMSSAATR